MKCKSCGASLELTASGCPGCGAEVELGRLTGILGIVCRACDAYNEPRARTCAACGKPLGSPEEPEEPEAHSPATSAAPSGTPAAGPLPSPPPAVPPPGAPVVRAFAKPSSGAATRFVPSVLRPSAPQRSPEPPALTPIPLASTCPRCGAEAGSGRFCSRCGQALGARGTQVMPKPAAAGRAATQGVGPLTPGRVKLVLEAGGGASWWLNAETADAGRSRGVIVFPDDPCLAPHHATFLYRGGALHVRDEGAPGGVFLRLRGTSVPIRAGDHFVVGERLLRYAGLVPSAPVPPPDGTRRLGSPRPPSPAIVVEEWLEGGTSGRVFVRGGPSLTIGRAGCAVNLGDDPHLSQAHAEILVDASGAARLKDLGSSSGTYAKIPPHGERELHDGDRIRMGREVLRVEVVG